MTGSPLVSVVMPAHDEERAISQVVVEVIRHLAAWTHEVIVVDDGSTDRTWAEIVALCACYPGVRGIRLTRNFGHQAALVAGLASARGAAVITMDADGQHPPELLPTLVQSWQDGYRVVQTVRHASPDEGWFKKKTSHLFYRVWSTLSGIPMIRGVADFRLMDRAVVDTVLASEGSLTFLRGLINWLGYETRYVTFEADRRIGGAPSYTWRKMLALSLDGLTSFSVVPLRIATALGVSVSAIAFVYLSYVLFIWLYSDRVVTGWASTAGLIAFVGGIQLFTIGVLGEYVGRIFLRSMDRPGFVLAETAGPFSIADRADSAAVGVKAGMPSAARGSRRERRLRAVPPAPEA